MVLSVVECVSWNVKIRKMYVFGRKKLEILEQVIRTQELLLLQISSLNAYFTIGTTYYVQMPTKNSRIWYGLIKNSRLY